MDFEIEITELKRRVRELEVKRELTSTVMTTLVQIGEETRLRVSNLEVGQDALRADVATLKADMTAVKADLTGVKTDVAGLRRDLPAMLAEAVREGLKAR